MSTVDIIPLTPAIGAEVRGVDMASPTPPVMEHLRRALDDHLVLFFRDQPISDADHIEFARQFGEVEGKHAYVETLPDAPEIIVLDIDEPKGLSVEEFHSDASGQTTPQLGALLRCVVPAPIGGDTCWASMYAAYDALSEPYKALLDGLTAVHDFSKPLAHYVAMGRHTQQQLDDVRRDHPPVAHPVVRTNPTTGRKGLYVNVNYTTRIVELEEHESQSVLNLMFNHVRRPEFQVRFRWQKDSFALWDNRFTQHCALADYSGHRRVMHRVAICGEAVQ